MKKKATTSSALAVILTVFVVALVWYLITPGYKAAKTENEEISNELVTLQEKIDWIEDVNRCLESV